MKLFLLRHDEDPTDRYISAVVAAGNEDEARGLDPVSGVPILDWEAASTYWGSSKERVRAQYLGEADSSISRGRICNSYQRKESGRSNW